MYCYKTNLPKTYWLKTTILFCSLFCGSGIQDTLNWVVCLISRNTWGWRLHIPFVGDHTRLWIPGGVFTESIFEMVEVENAWWDSLYTSFQLLDSMSLIDPGLMGSRMLLLIQCFYPSGILSAIFVGTLLFLSLDRKAACFTHFRHICHLEAYKCYFTTYFPLCIRVWALFLFHI